MNSTIEIIAARASDLFRSKRKVGPVLDCILLSIYPMTMFVEELCCRLELSLTSVPIFTRTVEKRFVVAEEKACFKLQRSRYQNPV